MFWEKSKEKSWSSSYVSESPTPGLQSWQYTVCWNVWFCRPARHPVAAAKETGQGRAGQAWAPEEGTSTVCYLGSPTPWGGKEITGISPNYLCQKKANCLKPESKGLLSEVSQRGL